MTAPKKLYAGAKSSVTVTTFDSMTRARIDRRVTLFLISQDRHTSYQLGTAPSGWKGVANMGFVVPPGLSGAYFLSARIEGIAGRLEVSATVTRSSAVLIETDKPIYKPGQKIEGRVVLLNSDLQPVSGSVKLVVQDAKGLRIAKWDLSADQYGIAPFSLDLASELNLGVWRVIAESASAQSQKDIRVERYVLPRFELAVELPKTWAVVDEQVEGVVDAHYFFGKPVSGTAKLVAKRWIGVWDQYATAQGQLSQGRFAFRLPAVGYVTGTPYNGGQGSIMLEVSVQDSTGHAQNTSETIVITEAPVVIGLSATSSSLKPEVDASVIVTTETPDGEAASALVSVATTFLDANGLKVGESKQDAETVEGRSEVVLHPPANTAMATVLAKTTIGKHTTQTVLEIGSNYSPSGNFLSLLRANSPGKLKVGDSMVCSAQASSAGTIYYEVYAGGRTVFSDVSEGGSFAFTVTPDMVPHAKVIAYVISDNNEVAADSLAFDVDLNLSASLSADFSAGEVKPGDPVRLTIDAGTGRKTMLGLSLVDQSVLALGQSRLHMAELFAELEKRFMEPVAEVHEEPGGFWAPPISSKGAIDILHDVGLEAVATAGVTIPPGVSLWWRGDFGPGIPVSPPAVGGLEKATPPEAPRVRQFFPETWVWQPTALTDDSGRLVLDLTAPDSITGWKLAVVGTCPRTGGQGLVLGESELTVFQEFFVEPSLPYSVTRGESLPLKVDVFNYLDQPQTVQLRLEPSSGFEIVGGTSVSVDVPANSASSAGFSIKTTGIGEFPLQIAAIGSRLSDAVLRQLKIVPEGWPAENIFNGVIKPGEQVPISLELPTMPGPLETIRPPVVVVPDSQRAFLYITPSPVAQTMQGVSDLLNMPFGCGEQNMIFLAPDVEILRYLRETGEINPEVRAKAEYYVNVGYQRELTYQTADGGFAAFGGDSGSLWLTAFVLSTFAAARDIRDIDDSVLQKASSMIKGRQNSDGSFRTDDFLIHTEMDGGVENAFSMCAYAANALADYGSAADSAALMAAAGYLQSSYPSVDDDSYSLALGAVALQKIPGFESAAEAIVTRLLELAVSDGSGVHWEPYPVETTGYVAMALMNANGGNGRPEAQQALDWLSTRRNALGGYGTSTQDTVVAIRALFMAADKVHRDINATVSVVDGVNTIYSVNLTGSNFDILQQFELPIRSGLLITCSGQGTIGYQVVNRYNLPGDMVPPSTDLELDVEYKAEGIQADEILDVDVTVRYVGQNAKTGMVIVDIGIPSGFEVVDASLAKLVDSKVLQRAEIAGRKVILYIEKLMKDEPLMFSFQMKALYPIRAAESVATAYEYYNRATEAYDRVAPGVRRAPRRREGSLRQPQ